MRAVLLLLLLAAPLRAETDYASAAEQAARHLRAAVAQLEAAETGDGRLAALGRAVTAYEQGLAAMRGGLRALAADEAVLEAQIAVRTETYRRLLGHLMALERTPAPALLTDPAGPVSHVRATHLLAAIAPEIEAQAEELRVALDERRRLRAQQTAAKAEARGALAALQTARAALAVALRKRKRPGEQLAPEDILGGARTLADFARILSASPVTDMADFSAAKGALPPPVIGDIALEFGARDARGVRQLGLTLTAPAYAQVTAPYAATVRYAGALKNFGNVIVLEPEAGHLIVLGGLARIDRISGETVMAGEPLGQLGDLRPDSEEILIEVTGGKRANLQRKLYIETREGGNPVDPLDWFDFNR